MWRKWSILWISQDVLAAMSMFKGLNNNQENEASQSNLQETQVGVSLITMWHH